MIIVESKGRRIDYVIKEYRQKVAKCGIHQEIRDRREYEKPSVKRRREKQKARRRNKWNN